MQPFLFSKRRKFICRRVRKQKKSLPKREAFVWEINFARTPPAGPGKGEAARSASGVKRANPPTANQLLRDHRHRVSGVDLHQATPLPAPEPHVGNIHFAGMDRLPAFVGMKNDLQIARLVTEHRAMPYADQIAGVLQQRIVIVFCPGTQRRIGRRAADAVIRAFIAVARIGHVVGPVVPDDETSLVHTGPNLLPRL